MQSFKNLTSTVFTMQPAFSYGWLPRFVAGCSLFSVSPCGGLPRATTVILIVDASCKCYCHLSSTVCKMQPMLNQPWLCGWSLTVLCFSLRRTTMEPPVTTVILIVVFVLQFCHSPTLCKCYYHLSSTVSLTQPMLNQPLLLAWLCGWSLTVLHFSIRRTTMEPPLSF